MNSRRPVWCWRTAPAARPGAAASPRDIASAAPGWTCDSGVKLLGCEEGVLKQGRHRHRAHPARHRCNPCSAFHGRLKTDIAGQTAVFQPVDTDIDYRSTRLDPLTRDDPGLAHGHDKDIRTRDMLVQVPCKTV